VGKVSVTTLSVFDGSVIDRGICSLRNELRDRTDRHLVIFDLFQCSNIFLSTGVEEEL
jgi:hypothetical protein